MDPSFTQEEIPSLQGAENARIILIALFSLTVYEWVITLDDEMKYFWTGSWGMSRILFLVNRYLPPVISLLALVCFSLPNPSVQPVPTLNDASDSLQFCKRGIQSIFVTGIVALGVVQAMLVVRVWYLFAQSRLTRLAMIAAFAVTNVLSLYFAIHAAIDLDITPDLTKFNIRGCRASRPPRFWRLYLPSLILHTVLYCLTAFRALRNRRVFKEAPILKRLVRDGGFFYFVVFISILFTAIGSFLQQYPKINVPAIYSNFTVATTSIAASRVMFSIHSLAAKLGSDSAWLLNNVELSRVPWRQGATEGEIIVDRFRRDDEDDDDDDDNDPDYSPSVSMSMVSLKTSRVGRWNDETW
ncbi:hypothetical protein DFH07DRAFT_957787 [Mycena maculata]|uniref:DUF6533 domain-containing protein n=1 Tax=Mycena maculata TaxID=230809 RepID=A0AAD7NGS0_9AGAR|nr:hypothetical protein DFH07DRAFT_957787 [Mycena maculata]